jgi:hypothetical protein
MDDLPPGEWQNDDRTYSSNQYCLKTSVGVVPVRVPADFSLPAADGVTYLMPSGKNDGLAAVHDGSGPRLGYAKPGYDVGALEDGACFVMCCVDVAVYNPMPTQQSRAQAYLNSVGEKVSAKVVRAVEHTVVHGILPLGQFLWAELAAFCNAFSGCIPVATREYNWASKVVPEGWLSEDTAWALLIGPCFVLFVIGAAFCVVAAALLAGLMALTFCALLYAGAFCAYWIVYFSVVVLQLTAWALFSLRLYFGVALAGTCAIIAFNRMLRCLCWCKSFLQSRSLADIEQV